MKNYKRIFSLIAVLLLGIMIVACPAAIADAAVDAAFEKQISAFPESYRPYLRKLHEEYPKWSFEVFDTGLDWETVVDNEHTDYALVYNPDAARIFKSLEADDYDAVNDKFYYKDGSFVAANRLAVEYFMDPRNFLDIGGIFQFELLSYSSQSSVDMVEAVLAGSFMSKAKITWLDEKGKSYTGTETYAEVIYKAGKTYNINPCFLASKILNEVGAYGSDSVSGKHETYPGYYNFYNIGATDGVGAIGRGLLWAKGGTAGLTTYSRPWNTPEKSIMGGAEFLAEEYIAAGQFTGYLQRFNVNPDSDYQLYSHQYMSNLTGALSQGYSTYRSYKSMGMLDMKMTFSIPVFKNMSNANGDEKLSGAESTEQYGTINRDYRYVRTGPSVDHSILTDASGKSLFVEKGAEVKILEKTDTDAYYYEEILTYPYWYKVSFTSSGKTYEGYIPASRVDVVTAVHVAAGQADIALARGNSIKNKIISSDPTMVKIIDGDTVNFLKNGFVKLYIYDSWGHFEEIRFKVGNYASYYASAVSATVSGKTVTVSSQKHATATGYGYSLCDKKGNIVKPEFTTKTSRVFSGLNDGAVYDIYVQNSFSKYIFTKAVRSSAVIKPAAVTGLDFTKDSSLNCQLRWNPVSDATGYQILSYDRAAAKYTALAVVPFGTNTYTVTAAQAKIADEYVVRAYSRYDGSGLYGDRSGFVKLSTKAPTPSGITFTDQTAVGFTIKWTGNSTCTGYQVYGATEAKPEPYLIKTVAGTSLKISGFKKPSLVKYKIRSYITTSSGTVYSDFTPLVEILSMPETPQNLTLTAGSTNVKASWNAVNGAKYYRLFYKAGNGKYQTVKVGTTSFTMENLKAFTDYSLYVTAVAENSGLTSESAASASVAIKTLPEIPTNLKVTYQGYNHIDLTWDKNANLTNHKVYYLDENGKVLGNIVTKENSVRITGLSPQTNYSFMIRGYRTVNGKYVSSDCSAAVYSKTVIPVVTNYMAVNATEKSFELTWDKLEGAEHYNVYYKKNGVYTKVAEPVTNSCTVDWLPASSYGSFYLTATFGKGEKAIESTRTAVFTASVMPSRVTGITLTPGTDSVTITWDKVKNATGYRVYTKQNGKYTKVKTITSNSLTLTGLESCSKQIISVRPYITTTTGVVFGITQDAEFYTKPYNITEITQSNKTDTSYTLNWKRPSAGVNRYYVYRYNYSLSTYECIGSTDKESFALKNITPGTAHRYTVLAALVVDGKIATRSHVGCNVIFATHLSKTENLRLKKATTSSISFTWDKVKNATSYGVYYYHAASKSFKLYKEVDTNSITIDGLDSGKSVIFRVKAVRRAKGLVFNGYSSANFTASTK